MNWFQILTTLLLAVGMGAFYYLMDFSPRGLRHVQVDGKPFQMPDMRLHYSADDLYRLFEQAQDNRPRMRRYWLLDFGFIACFLGVMLAIGRNIAHTNATLELLMGIAAIIRATFDVAENCLLLSLYRAYPARKNRLATVAGAVTTTKFLFLFAWVAMLFVKLFGAAFGITI